MMTVITSVYATLQGGGSIVLLASFAWGILGMILSPCALITIPLVVGYIEAQEETSAGKAFFISVAFSLGVFINIALVGVIIASAGSLMAELSRIMNYFVAAVFILFGLHLLEVISIPWLKQSSMKAGSLKGLFGAWFLGLFSGLAIGPCAFAYLAPLLVLAMKAATSNFLYSMLMVFMYALGNCLILIMAGTSAGFMTGFMKLDEASRFTLVMNHVLGIILIGASLYFIYNAP
ncbi:MAG: cytochrome C biogenesis protein [Synergistales bacterium]|nr:cytochrome C biogenesis protein [Synergistales bacterium]